MSLLSLKAFCDNLNCNSSRVPRRYPPEEEESVTIASLIRATETLENRRPPPPDAVFGRPQTHRPRPGPAAATAAAATATARGFKSAKMKIFTISGTRMWPDLSGPLTHRGHWQCASASTKYSSCNYCVIELEVVHFVRRRVPSGFDGSGPVGQHINAALQTSYTPHKMSTSSCLTCNVTVQPELSAASSAGLSFCLRPQPPTSSSDKPASPITSLAPKIAQVRHPINDWHLRPEARRPFSWQERNAST